MQSNTAINAIWPKGLFLRLHTFALVREPIHLHLLAVAGVESQRQITAVARCLQRASTRSDCLKCGCRVVEAT